MAYQYTDRHVAMGAHSGSTSTSPAFFIGDFQRLTISIQTSNTTSSSTFIIQVSNADGLQVGDLAANGSQSTGWSNLTIIQKASLNLDGNVGRGQFQIDPTGYRWVRSATSADPQTASRGTLIFVGTSF
jgi:hypothetical protein